MKIDINEEIQRLSNLKAKLERLIALQEQVINLQMELIPHPVKMEQVDFLQKAVCQHYGITMTKLCSKYRTTDVVEPRQVLAFLLVQAGLECNRIGRLIDRDHTTVRYSVEAVKARMETDRKFCAVVAGLQAAQKSINGSNGIH